MSLNINHRFALGSFIQSRILKIFNYLKYNSIKKILSPYSGNVVPSELIGNINIKNDIFGTSLGVLPFKNEVKAPCDCLVEKISAVGNGIRLKVGSVIIILNVGLEADKYSKDLFNLLVKEGDRVEKGQTILTFDADKLYSIDRTFVCVITVRQTKAKEHITFINSRKLNFDSIICNINTN